MIKIQMLPRRCVGSTAATLNGKPSRGENQPNSLAYNSWSIICKQTARKQKNNKKRKPITNKNKKLQIATKRKNETTRKKNKKERNNLKLLKVNKYYTSALKEATMSKVVPCDTPVIERNVMYPLNLQCTYMYHGLIDHPCRPTLQTVLCMNSATTIYTATRGPLVVPIPKTGYDAVSLNKD